LNILNIKYETNKKIPNKKSEIDIYLPDFKLGIEFNGLYWHNELFKTKNYHLNKTIDCNTNGIELIHIFEDEWLYKKEIVLSIIKNRLGITSDRIYARKCEIKEINSKESKKFLNENHIQGNVNSKVKIGLFYENKLVSLMTFSKGRILMGGKNTEWELNRFCNVIGLNVVGGASKLFNCFIKIKQPKTVISFCDLRYGTGNLYKKLKFEFLYNTNPNYFYIKDGKRYNRFSYRKNILIEKGFDKNKTEMEIMKSLGYNRIYDCGSMKFQWNA
jgi:hypothetical protein